MNYVAKEVIYAKSWGKLASSPECSNELHRTHHEKGITFRKGEEKMK